MRTRIRRLRTVCALTLLGAPCLAAAPLEDVGWPREIVANEATIVVYQPQPERFEGVELTGRAAVSVQRTKDSEPVFGAVWLTARVETDREAGVVFVEDIAEARSVRPSCADRQWPGRAAAYPWCHALPRSPRRISRASSG